MKLFLTILIFLITYLTYAQDQQDSTKFINLNFEKYCIDNFSLQGDDSLFVNFYISNFRDTIFFNSANCIVTAEPSTPHTFRRRTLNGWAHGDLQVYYKNDSTYNWTSGAFENGILVHGSFYEYYNIDDLRLTGQYAYGHRHGVWTWYYPNGKIERIITFEFAEPIKEVEFNYEGKIIDQYDVIKEKTNSKKPYKP